MATASSANQTALQIVTKKLRHLRRRLTGWIFVRGSGRWLFIVLAILAADMLLDRMFKMDFAQRLILLVFMVAVVGLYFFWKVVRPLMKHANDDALLHQVESKNPDLKESLISSWQLAREKDLQEFGFSPELAAATIASGIQKAEGINFANALDIPHHRQNWALLLAGLVVSTGLIVGIAQTDFLRTWFNRNILLNDDQWPQATYLEIAGVEDGRLVLPRGADHRQIVTVREDSSVTDVDVTIEVDNPGGRMVHQMKRTGKQQGREQVFVFHNVSSQFRFRASGGDDTTDWIEVDLVEPPAVISLGLRANLPEYTSVGSLELPGAGPHAVLGGSSLRIKMTTNKSLKRAAVKLGDEVFDMRPAAEPETYSLTIPADELRGGQYEFRLEDQSGLKNSRPSKFTIKIKEDQPPKVRANLLGISGLVVPRAMLPTSYQVADEYGVRRLVFDCVWKLGAEDQEPVIRQVGISDFPGGPSPVREVKDVAVLDLLPLQLSPGASFRFSVAATDSCPGGPGIGKSQEFLLRVVSDEELRADLLRREIEQRKAFEQAYEIQMELATEIQAIAAQQPSAGMTVEQFQSQRETELIGLVRNQKSIGTAVARVADRFEEFLVEVKNNRLDEAENAIAPSQKIEARFDEGIIQPIRRLDQEWISLATRNLDNCRRTSNDDTQLNQNVDQTALIHQRVLAEMKRILDAMNDSENFQEVINDLLEIKEDSASVKSEIEKKLKPKDIFDEDDGIFDK
jgi:hypothetical protein